VGTGNHLITGNYAGDVNHKTSSGFTLLSVTGGVPVGGLVTPIDKLALLYPFIGLASLIVAATTVTAVYVSRARHREERQ